MNFFYAVSISDKLSPISKLPRLRTVSRRTREILRAAHAASSVDARGSEKHK